VWSLPFRFPGYNFVCISHLRHACYMHRPSHLWLYLPNNLWWSVQFMKLLIMQLSTASCHFLFFRNKYFPQHPMNKMALVFWHPIKMTDCYGGTNINQNARTRSQKLQNNILVHSKHRKGILKMHMIWIRGCIQKFPHWVITKQKTIIIKNTRSEATQRVMAAKLTRMTHKIAIQLHLVAESCTICSSRSRRPVRKLLDTPS
jgi:hypothetical protein